MAFATSREVGARTSFVAGFVKGKSKNRDGTFSCRVVDARFSLPGNSTFANILLAAPRALIYFEIEGKKVRVTNVIVNPSMADIRKAAG